MKEITEEKLKDEILQAAVDSKCLDYGGKKDLSISISQMSYGIEITIGKMYDRISVTMDFLDALSKIFSTDKIDVSDGDFYGGCETCDYGSSYEMNFLIKGAQIKILS